MAMGEKAAKDSNGLFKPEDWMCPMCGNVNYARRSHCHLCKHPREGKQENRAGLGGGFKENVGTEYKQHDSDEEMYDEVGTHGAWRSCTCCFPRHRSAHIAHPSRHEATSLRPCHPAPITWLALPWQHLAS